jgi:hypothetical protein
MFSFITTTINSEREGKFSCFQFVSPPKFVGFSGACLCILHRSRSREQKFTSNLIVNPKTEPYHMAAKFRFFRWLKVKGRMKAENAVKVCLCATRLRLNELWDYGEDKNVNWWNWIWMWARSWIRMRLGDVWRRLKKKNRRKEEGKWV